MNHSVINNFSKLSWQWLLLPIFIVLFIVVFLLSHRALSTLGYVEIQKDLFFYLNDELAYSEVFQYNLTQIGDALIFLSFLSLLVIYAPKVWEALIFGLLVSVAFSVPLKEFIDVPRPAQMFDPTTFHIAGKTIVGYASLPSGHSITTFTIITVLLFAFAPQKKKYRIIWFLLIPILAFKGTLTRVAVGAHYPLDVLIGSSIGFFSGVSGIILAQKYRLWHWVGQKKYHPIFMALFAGSIVVLIIKITKEPLFIFYLSIASIIYSLYAITKVYIQK
ncbi:phosphatase PAP2 family protein [Riemerella columbina]|uniref:phosphatase PAP2 family protein n=1 Tax=Riemerella columbina TaxID=103810 RepID=UPI000475FF84|nr:phosphatase PAP2 family protein [Riemerella columbina]